MSFAFCPPRGRSFSAPLRFSTVLLQALSLVDALDSEAEAAEPDEWPPPGAGATRKQLLQFARFNRRAAAADGYTVS